MAVEKIKTLIVEDQSIVALDLATGLELEGYQVIGIADNADDARQLFKAHEVDVILMDIHLAGSKDGIDTVMDLMTIRQIPVIYLTAYTDAATISRVKQTYPAAFLSKPYNITNVRIAIELALNNFAVLKEEKGQGRVIPLDGGAEGRKEGSTGKLATPGKEGDARKDATPGKDAILQMDDCIFIKSNYQFVKIRLSDILYIESDNNYIQLHAGDKKFLLRLSLNQLIEKLLFKKLVRIHRSYAVNIDAIQSFTDQDVMIGKKELPIGRNHKDDFLKHFDFR